MKFASLLPNPFPRPLRVLLADDTPSNCLVFKAFLERLGCEVDVASDGQEAVEHFSQRECDVVLLDVEMPRLDGVAAARVMRERLGGRWLPIVFLTTLDGEEEFIQGLDAGGDEYLVKPVTLTMLAARLRALVRSLALHRATEDARNRERAITDTLVDGVVVADEAGVIEWCNPAALRMFGYSAGELVGQRINALMPAPFRADHDMYVQRYLNCGRPRVIGVGQRELVGQRKDGSTFALELGVADVPQGERRLFVGICRDVSARKLAEAQARRHATRAELLSGERLTEHHLALQLIVRQHERPGLRDSRVHHLALPSPRFSGDLVAAATGPGDRLAFMFAHADGEGLVAAARLMPLVTAFYEHGHRAPDVEGLAGQLDRVMREALPLGAPVNTTLVMLDSARGNVELLVSGMPPVAVVAQNGVVRTRVDQGLHRMKVVEGEQLALGSVGLLALLGSAELGFSQLADTLCIAEPAGRLEAVKNRLSAADLPGERGDATLVLLDCG